jgi:hypothetical protein
VCRQNNDFLLRKRHDPRHQKFKAYFIIGYSM